MRKDEIIMLQRVEKKNPMTTAPLQTLRIFLILYKFIVVNEGFKVMNSASSYIRSGRSRGVEIPHLLRI